MNRTAVVCTLALASCAAGCGGQSDAVREADKRLEESRARLQREAKAAREAMTAEVAREAAEAAREAKAAAVERRRTTGREKEILAAYDAVDGRREWSIESVSVDGGTVEVQTSLHPDEEGRPFFTGACANLIGAAGWIERVEIYGSDDYSHALWDKGDVVCRVLGLEP